MTTIAPPLTVIAENIPLALKEGKRFVAWRYEARKGQPKPAKMPYSPIMENPKEGASSTNPAHWTTFEGARTYTQVAGLDGIMRAFDHADELVGIDLDNIRNPETGELTPRAAAYVKRLDTYTEVSPSGTGVKMWARGLMPAFGHKRGDVEMYGSVAGKAGPCGRLFTMTGHQLEGTPAEVMFRPDAIAAIHREVFGDAPDLTIAATDPDRPIPALELGDEDVLRLASESPHNGERFRRLWDGDTSDYANGGNDGESEADCALCELLAYYGGPDPERIERLFSRSGLVRDKWDRADYRKRTIDKALDGKTRFYGDSTRPTAPASGSDDTTVMDGAELARLRRRALDQDDLIEYQRAVITRQRRRLDALEGYLTAIDDVLANPNQEASDKLLILVGARELHTRLSKGKYSISLGRLADLTGLHPNTVSKRLDRISSLDPDVGAPFRKIVTRRQTVPDDVDAPPQWISSLEVTPWAETPRETLRVAAAYIPPAQPKRGGSKQAAEARWKPFEPCADHQDANLIISGACTVCEAPVGATIIRPEECEILNHTFGDSANEAIQPVSVVTKGHTFGDSEQPALIDFEAASSRRVVAIEGTQLIYDDSEPAEPTLPAGWTGPPPPVFQPPRKCPTLLPDGRQCEALVVTGRDGIPRCVGRKHRVRTDVELAAVAGGSE